MGGGAKKDCSPQKKVKKDKSYIVIIIEEDHKIIRLIGTLNLVFLLDVYV